MENHNYMLIADDAGEFRDTCIVRSPFHCYLNQELLPSL